MCLELGLDFVLSLSLALFFFENADVVIKQLGLRHAKAGYILMAVSVFNFTGVVLQMGRLEHAKKKVTDSWYINSAGAAISVI